MQRYRLSRVTAGNVRLAFEFFVRRRRKRVLTAQTESRRLARFAFVKSVPMSLLRNLAMRLYPPQMVASGIRKSFDATI